MWADDITEALDVLARADWGHAVFEIADTEGHYVQILRDDEPGSASGLLEAVSNEFLYDDEEITPEQEAALAHLGWARPYTECDPAEGCPLEHCNWYRFVVLDGTPGTHREILGLIMATLAVYGLREGTEVNVSYRSSLGNKGTPKCE